MAITEAVNEAIWLDSFIMEIRFTQRVINFHCDSQSALHIVASQIMDNKVKHIGIRFHRYHKQCLKKLLR